MRVTGTFLIRGKGPVVTVEDAPPTASGRGIIVGVLVHQGTYSWKVTGIERFAIEAPQTKLSLLLKSLSGSPALPEEGVLEL